MSVFANLAGSSEQVSKVKFLPLQSPTLTHVLPYLHVHGSTRIQGTNWNSFCCCLIVFLDGVRGVGVSHVSTPRSQLPTELFFWPKPVLSATKNIFAYRETNSALCLCSYYSCMNVLLWICSLISLVAAVTSSWSLEAECVRSSYLHIVFIRCLSLSLILQIFLHLSAVFQEHQLGPPYMFARLLLG